MSTDKQPFKPLIDKADWPGRALGVPPPPSQADIDEVSRDQSLISDDWAPEPATRPIVEPKGA
jgi:hypothetical protein